MHYIAISYNNYEIAQYASDTIFGQLEAAGGFLTFLMQNLFRSFNKILVSRDKDYLTERSSIDQHNPTTFFLELCYAWSREAGILSRSFASLFASRSPSTMVREAQKEQEH